MRIAQIMFSDGWGGAERLFVELCSSLSSGGHDVLTVCKPTFKQGERLRNFPLLRYESVAARCNWDYFSAWQLSKIIQDFKPDLIHAHLSRAAWMSGLVGKSKRIPVVTTTHNKIKAKYIKNIGYFTAVTDELKSYVMSLGVPVKNVVKIPNFSLINPVPELSVPSRSPLTFIALGRFVRKKGFDVLLKAFAEYQARATVPTRLILAGDGPLGEQLKLLAHRLCIDDSVEFPGWVDDVSLFYDQGDVFVLPSRDEPFGIVLLEAMARGKTIIATNIGGPRDFLNRRMAFLVQPDDVRDLCSAMLSAADNPELSKCMALESLNVFKECYTPDAVVPKYEDFYRLITNAATLPSAFGEFVHE